MAFLFSVTLFCFTVSCFIWLYLVYIYMTLSYIIRHYLVSYVDVSHFMRHSPLGCGKSGLVPLIWTSCSGFMEKSLFFWLASTPGLVGTPFPLCAAYSKIHIQTLYITERVKITLYRIRFSHCLTLGRSIKACIPWSGPMWATWLKLIGPDIIFDLRSDLQYKVLKFCIS